MLLDYSPRLNGVLPPTKPTRKFGVSVHPSVRCPVIRKGYLGRNPPLRYAPFRAPPQVSLKTGKTDRLTKLTSPEC